MKCPFCGCRDFYVKDPHAEYETHEFTIDEGKVCFTSQDGEQGIPEIREDTRTYCKRCAWQGKLNELNAMGG